MTKITNFVWNPVDDCVISRTKRATHLDRDVLQNVL